MAIYWLGSPLGLILSFFVGGWVADHFGWRMTFFVMGIPGILLALLARFTIKDPRRIRATLQSVDEPNPPFGAVFALLWKRRSCRHLAIAIILVYALSYGVSPWEAAFLSRSHGMTTAEIGFWLGTITSGAGIVGLFLGSYVANRWFTTNARGQLRTSGLVVASVMPSFLWFLLAPGKGEALVALAPFALSFIFFMAPTFALLQRLVPDTMRATMLALIMFLANLLGMGLGPQIIGILSDLLAPRFGADSLRYALVIASVGGIWAAVHFWLAGRTVEADLAEAEA